MGPDGQVAEALHLRRLPRAQALGREGWELGKRRARQRNTQPNFGNSGYVTRLRDHDMRVPAMVTLLFKRFWTQPTKTP